MVARWSHQVPQLQPPPGCQHYQHGGLPASPSQVMMEAAIGRGWSEKSSTLLETCWRLVSFLIKLEVQWGSRFSRANQKKNWKAASKHHWHHSKSYHQGSSSRPSKHLKTAAKPELLAVDTGAVRLRAARQLGDNEQRCAMNIGTTTLGDPYTILASANVRFSPYDLIPGWNLQKGICFLTFCVLLWSFPLIKMVEAARRLSLFFAVGWLKFCELPSPVKERESLKIDVARIFGSNIGSKTDRVFVDLQSFLVIPICWKPSIWFFSFSQTWASMAATAKHVSEISAFSYHPIHLPQGSNIPGHLDSQRQWGRLFLHPIEQVFHGDSAALQSPSRSFSKTWLHVWRAFSNRLLPNEGVFDLLRGNNRCSVLRVFSADSPQAWNMTADSYENNCGSFNRQHFLTASFLKGTSTPTASKILLNSISFRASVVL